MDQFSRLMQTHNMLSREFQQLRSKMQQTLFYLEEFNRQAANNVEDCKRALYSVPKTLQNNRREKA